jgi:O-antigen/teichoic acid export membrane protein
MKSIIAIQAVFFQGLAAICTVLTTYYVSTKLGASGQGEWALLKSNVEFIAALMSFGFPISYTYFINKIKANKLLLVKQYFIYLVVITPVIYFSLKLGFIEVKSSVDEYIVEYIVLMGVLISIYSNIRGVMLASYSLIVFNLISFLLPAAILFTFFLYNFEDSQDIVYGYVIACSVILFGSLIAMLASDGGEEGEIKVRIFSFYKYSIWNFISNIGPYLYLIIINHWLLANGFSYHELGLISVVLLVQGSILLIPNVLGPLLYRNWSVNNELIISTYRKTLFLFLIISTLILLVMHPVLEYLIVNLLGKEFINTVGLIEVLMLSIPFSFAIRVLLNACLSVGAAKEYAIATNVKNLMILFSLILYKPRDLFGVVYVISFFEFLTFVLLAFLARRNLNCSVWFLLGIKKYVN